MIALRNRQTISVFADDVGQPSEASSLCSAVRPARPRSGISGNCFDSWGELWGDPSAIPEDRAKAAATAACRPKSRREIRDVSSGLNIAAEIRVRCDEGLGTAYGPVYNIRESTEIC